MLLAPDQDHKKVFPDVPVVGFRNGKTLEDYLVRAAVPKTKEKWNLAGKLSKIQSGP